VNWKKDKIKRVLAGVNRILKLSLEKEKYYGLARGGKKILRKKRRKVKINKQKQT